MAQLGVLPMAASLAIAPGSAIKMSTLRRASSRPSACQGGTEQKWQVSETSVVKSVSTSRLPGETSTRD
eukprot:scaffold257648_cov27-Tisochrysis_lutea.AAC.1